MMQFSMRLLPALVLSHLWLGAVLAQSADQADALHWLERIAAAARGLNYTGTFVYTYGEQSETSRITHFVDRSGEYEKLETRDGPRREIIRNDNEILTFYADSRVLRREKRAGRKLFPGLLPRQLSILTEYYHLRKGGQERIAGHDSQALILLPRDEFRYGHKLWAELNSGLLLKAKMLNEHDKVVEQFQFTEITINAPLTRDSVRPSFPIAPSDPRARLAAEPRSVDTGWWVRNQPAGFKQILEMRRAKQGGEGQVSHLVFSDGLAAVSVFIEPLLPSRKVVEGPSQRGAVNIYMRPVDDQLVTVLGETPPVTVMQIAQSVAPKSR
jgi:sigma-E factor negative regulatory protein RseB